MMHKVLAKASDFSLQHVPPILANNRDNKIQGKLEEVSHFLLNFLTYS